jgi:hypothetical protein
VQAVDRGVLTSRLATCSGPQRNATQRTQARQSTKAGAAREDLGRLLLQEADGGRQTTDESAALGKRGGGQHPSALDGQFDSSRETHETQKSPTSIDCVPSRLPLPLPLATCHCHCHCHCHFPLHRCRFEALQVHMSGPIISSRSAARCLCCLCCLCCFNTSPLPYRTTVPCST